VYKKRRRKDGSLTFKLLSDVIRIAIQTLFTKRDALSRGVTNNSTKDD